MIFWSKAQGDKTLQLVDRIYSPYEAPNQGKLTRGELFIERPNLFSFKNILTYEWDICSILTGCLIFADGDCTYNQYNQKRIERERQQIARFVKVLIVVSFSLI